MPPYQQRCRCGWLLPREVFVEEVVAGAPPERVRIVTICPVCGLRAECEIKRSAEA